MNPSKVSPAMTAEEIVKAVYPRAYRNYWKDTIFSDHKLWAGKGNVRLGTDWIDAASRLPASPVAEGESQIEDEKYSCDTSKDVSNGFICGAWTRRASGPYINFETKQRRMGVYRCDRPDGHKGQHVDHVLGTNFMEDESI